MFNYSQVSAAKNLAMASWKIARVDEQCLERLSLMIHQYKEAFKHFSFGFHHSVDVKPESWRDGLLASAQSCWEEMRHGRVSELSMENRAMTYHDLVQHIQIPQIQAECYIELSNCHFHCGITAIQNKDFKRGIGHISIQSCKTTTDYVRSVLIIVYVSSGIFICVNQIIFKNTSSLMELIL